MKYKKKVLGNYNESTKKSSKQVLIIYLESNPKVPVSILTCCKCCARCKCCASSTPFRHHFFQPSNFILSSPMNQLRKVKLKPIEEKMLQSINGNFWMCQKCILDAKLQFFSIKKIISSLNLMYVGNAYRNHTKYAERKNRSTL